MAPGTRTDRKKACDGTVCYVYIAVTECGYYVVAVCLKGGKTNIKLRTLSRA